VLYRIVLMVSWTKAVGDLEIALTQGRRVVHRTHMLVEESAEYSLAFWDEARRGFLSVRGERETIR